MKVKIIPKEELKLRIDALASLVTVLRYDIKNNNTVDIDTLADLKASVKQFLELPLIQGLNEENKK